MHNCGKRTNATNMMTNGGKEMYCKYIKMLGHVSAVFSQNVKRLACSNLTFKKAPKGGGGRGDCFRNFGNHLSHFHDIPSKHFLQFDSIFLSTHFSILFVPLFEEYFVRVVGHGPLGNDWGLMDNQS